MPFRLFSQSNHGMIFHVMLWSRGHVTGKNLLNCDEILNRNESGNVRKEGDKITQGLTNLTTDKPRASVRR